MEPELWVQILLGGTAGVWALQALLGPTLRRLLANAERAQRRVDRALARRRPQSPARTARVEVHGADTDGGYFRVAVSLGDARVVGAHGLTSVDPGADYVHQTIVATWDAQSPLFPISALPTMQSEQALFLDRERVRFTVRHGEMVLDFMRPATRVRLSFLVQCVVDVDALEPILGAWVTQLPPLVRGASADVVSTGRSDPRRGQALRLFLQVNRGQDVAQHLAHEALESPSHRVRLEAARALTSDPADAALKTIATTPYREVADDVARDALTLLQARMAPAPLSDVILESGRVGNRWRRVDALERLLSLEAPAQTADMAELVLSKGTPQSDLTRRALAHLETHRPDRARTLALTLLERGEEAILAIETLERVGDASCFQRIRALLDEKGLSSRERKRLVTCYERIGGLAQQSAAGGLSIADSPSAEGGMSLADDDDAR